MIEHDGSKEFPELWLGDCDTLEDYGALDESTIQIITASEQAAGQRLDSYAAGVAGLTRSKVQRLIESNDILVNGKAVKPKYAVRAGDEISIFVPAPSETELIAQEIPLDIVYEDADIAVINKPVGMVVHPAAGNPSGTLVNALLFHLKDLSGIGGELRPGIVHRIDKNTSGLIVVAKNDFAHNFLAEQLKTHSVRRTYLALCTGNFKEDSGTVNAPIGRHRTDRKRMAVVPNGREAEGRYAVTHFKVLERFGSMTLLRVELETGRTHQIRVHLSYINHPLVGDDVYGRSKNSLGFIGQALHAAELRLTHPRTGEELIFTADMPETFKNALEKLRKEQK
ncbi:MAG: RluA family pseudouridine synthase [Christensenellaceae bacterium]|nr:RluA family pseudouridine synthase [Christensenellaceae bacterium]